MTDYLRPMAAYVATLGGHHDHPDRAQWSTQDTTADTSDAQGGTTVDDADSGVDKGGTR